MLSLTAITAWNLLVAYGVSMIPSGRAAILAYTMPAWAIPLSVWLLGERLNGRRITGLLLGMAGLALLLGEGVRNLGTAPVGSLLVLCAAVMWALATVFQKRFPVAMPVGVYTAWIMLLGGIPIFIGALILDDLRADFIRFEYDDFRDLREVGVTPGEEPLYSLNSLVLRIYVSLWY